MNTLPPHDLNNKSLPETTFIYRLCDPETKEIRYIGKADNPHKRLLSHRSQSRTNHSAKNVWVASLLDKGLSPEMEIIEEIPYALWKERECYWISYYRENGYSLTNIADGGNAIPDAYIRSAATRALISQIHMGMIKTPEQKDAQSALYKQLGIKPPPEAYDILRTRLKGKPVDPEVLAKKRAAIKAKKDAGIPSKKRTTSDGLKTKRRAYMSTYWQRERSQGNRSALTNEQAAIIKFNVLGLPQKEYAVTFGVSTSIVSGIACGTRYKHITREHLPLEIQGQISEPTLCPGRDSQGYPLLKLTNTQAAIIKFNAYGLMQREYAALFGISQPTISSIIHGHTYQHITREDLPDEYRGGSNG